MRCEGAGADFKLILLIDNIRTIGEDFLTLLNNFKIQHAERLEFLSHIAVYDVIIGT